jgi:hypothetical protein
VVEGVISPAEERPLAGSVSMGGAGLADMLGAFLGVLPAELR